jgi:hypothetical protein
LKTLADLRGHSWQDHERLSLGKLQDALALIQNTIQAADYLRSELRMLVLPRPAATAYETNSTEHKAIKPVVKKAKVLVGHSVGGDLDHLVKLGLAKNEWLAGFNIRDSLLLARMFDENRGKGGYGLEALLISEFNFAPWKGETEKLIKATGNAADWTPEQRIARCRLDAWATHILADHFEKKLSQGKKDDGDDS